MKRRGSLVAALLALQLLVAALAMSPSLHHLLHHDADAPDHQCAATLLLDGQLDCPETPGFRAAACLAEIGRTPEPHETQPWFAKAAPTGRAPPRL